MECHLAWQSVLKRRVCVELCTVRVYKVSEACASAEHVSVQKSVCSMCVCRACVCAEACLQSVCLCGSIGRRTLSAECYVLAQHLEALFVRQLVVPARCQRCARKGVGVRVLGGRVLGVLH